MDYSLVQIIYTISWDQYHDDIKSLADILFKILWIENLQRLDILVRDIFICEEAKLKIKKVHRLERIYLQGAQVIQSTQYICIQRFYSVSDQNSKTKTKTTIFCWSYLPAFQH